MRLRRSGWQSTASARPVSSASTVSCFRTSGPTYTACESRSRVFERVNDATERGLPVYVVLREDRYESEVGDGIFRYFDFTKSYFRKTTILGLLWCILFTIIPVGCNDDGEDNMTDKAIQEIKYYFRDASVPPEYHRSYAITVTPDMVRIVVESYGEILADEKYGITHEQFIDARNSLKRNEIRNCTLGEDEGCSGGTSERISYTDGENEIFSGSIYHCGGKDTGNLCGDILGFADNIKSLVPNLDSLLQ